MKAEEKLDKLLSALGIKRSELTNRINASSSLFTAMINRGSDFSLKVINRILEVYPSVSKEFLISGTGPVLIDEVPGEPYMVTARISGSYLDQDFVELPLLDARAMASFEENIYGSMYKLETGRTYKVMKIPGHHYEQSMVLDIVGDSMLPNFRNGMKVIIREVSEGRWATATGIHALSIKGGMFTIKRIISNSGNLITLKADNPDYPEQLKVQVSDILIMFRVGEIVYAPPVQDL